MVSICLSNERCESKDTPKLFTWSVSAICTPTTVTDADCFSVPTLWAVPNIATYENLLNTTYNRLTLFGLLSTHGYVKNAVYWLAFEHKRFRRDSRGRRPIENPASHCSHSEFQSYALLSYVPYWRPVFIIHRTNGSCVLTPPKSAKNWQ